MKMVVESLLNTQPRGFAFFDVDETLVIEKTMFSVLKALGEQIPTFDSTLLLKHLYQIRSEGAERMEVNRAFYRGLSGLDRSQVVNIACNYIKSRIAEDNKKQFFIRCSVSLLLELREKGILPVFVSGSACDFLGALADHLGVYHVLATKLEVSQNGKYTGNIHGRSIIGRGKAEAVTEFLKHQSVDPSVCYGIGDHVTDAEFISLLGHGFIVAGEAEDLAMQMGWKILKDDVFVNGLE